MLLKRMRKRILPSSFIFFLTFSFLLLSAFIHPTRAASDSYSGYYSGLKISTQIEDNLPPIDVYLRLQRCQELAMFAYQALPPFHQIALRKLVLVWSSKMGRGLGGGDTIYLRCNNVSDHELVGVFVHEMGHIVDTGLIQGSPAAGSSVFRDSRIALFNDDQSLEFYSINWTSATRKISNSSRLDFVSGYAQTDPFEDFAESYLFYLIHGQQFFEMSQQNDRLKRKYEFLRDKIFYGVTFENHSRKAKIGSRSFDATLLPFSLEKFLKRV